MSKTIQINRFRVERRLGKGLQGSVYYAWDEDLQRPVAIKILHNAAANRVPEQVQNLAKLRHPNIVSLYETGTFNGFTYLVFEYVEGVSLSARLRSEGIYAVEPALKLMDQILDALAHAHRHGIAHLDLSPGNVMLEHGHTAKVMDFDLSERLGPDIKSVASTLTGTPYYMAPEHFTSKRLDYRTDVYALGAILFEILTGNTTVNGQTDHEIIYNIINTPVSPDALNNPALTPELINCISKAVAKDPADRFQDATAMRVALADCRNAPGNGTANNDATAFLLRRMKRRKDFPAVSRTLIEVNRLTSDDSTASSEDLARVILRDYAVTNKLLRLANSSYYGVRPGQIKSVSDAVRVLGMDQVRTATNSLLYMNQFNDKGRTPDVIDLQIGGFLTGLVARHLAQQSGLKLAEEAFLCGMFHSLGKSLVAYYLPEEYAEIVGRTRSGQETSAAVVNAVLGISYASLANAVAQEWGFPDMIIATLNELPLGPLGKPQSIAEALHQVTVFADRLCNMVDEVGPDHAVSTIAQTVQHFQQTIPLSAPEAKHLLGAAVVKLAEFAPLLDVVLSKSGFHQRLTQWLNQSVNDVKPVPPPCDSPAIGAGKSHRFEQTQRVATIP
jgi:eukaryotic-like serine/threonine-protein kinase